MERMSKLPICLIDPSKDRMRNKRFDGLERDGEDETISYNGPCYCNMPPEIRHLHKVANE